MKKVILSVDSSVKYQRFDGIGASGAWWAQLVGGWDHTDPATGLPVCEAIARLLYDKEQGIGLNAYRYNIGTGSAESGNSDIDMLLRRTHGIEDENGNIDLSLDKNAVNMLRLAVKYGAGEVVLFVNSPPERMTANGKANCDKGFPPKENLPKENYKAFVDFCLDVTEKFIDSGIDVTYLSPVNEPLWVWTGGQEGCHYKARSAKKLMRLFAIEMNKREKLNAVKLSGLENGDVRWYNKSYTRAMLGDKLVSDRTDGIDVHSYFLTPVSVPFFNKRVPYIKRFNKWMKRHYPGKDIKVSEWCHMQGGRDSSMKSALVTANVIFEDLTILNAVSWQHWIAVSEVDYCDGLIYIEQDEGTYSLTKRYFVTGNFSKFIPLGAARIKAESGSDDVRTLAYEKDGTVYQIVINNSDDSIEASVPSDSGKAYITDENSSLSEAEFINGKITLPAKSVNTLIYLG